MHRPESPRLIPKTALTIHRAPAISEKIYPLQQELPVCVMPSPLR
jgi:hypothetical protein